LSKQQLDNIDKLIAAGSRPENDRFDILSQVATDDQNLITAENNIEINLLSLKQQMWMEPNYPLQIERPVLNFEGVEPLENEPFDTVYFAALATQPQIKAAEEARKKPEASEKKAEPAPAPTNDESKAAEN